MIKSLDVDCIIVWSGNQTDLNAHIQMNEFIKVDVSRRAFPETVIYLEDFHRYARADHE